jgi:hypothetical protein
MGVTRSNLKPIVKGSGRYHEIRWNVEKSSSYLTVISPNRSKELHREIGSGCPSS